MGHGIYQPHDIVQSNQGTEWHTFAEHREFIGDKEVEKQLFDIIESPAFVIIDGEQTALDNYKVLVADHRKVRPDLFGSDALVPLHIPKAGYKVISNREIWNVMQKSLRDLDCKVTSVCTLERGKKFAISADIGSSDLVINKDKFKANLNFVTSHDGTMAMETFDSAIRIVCMNTFQWSRDAAKDKFKVYHTKNSSFALDGLGDLASGVVDELSDRALGVDLSRLAARRVVLEVGDLILSLVGGDADERVTDQPSALVKGLDAHLLVGVADGLRDLTQGVVDVLGHLRGPLPTL
jgi:hypothetical protein